MSNKELASYRVAIEPSEVPVDVFPADMLNIRDGFLTPAHTSPSVMKYQINQDVRYVTYMEACFSTTPIPTNCTNMEDYNSSTDKPLDRLLMPPPATNIVRRIRAKAKRNLPTSQKLCKFNSN